MPEMQETTSTSDTIYTDIERKEEKLSKHDLNTDQTTLKTMTASNDNSNMADTERLQQDTIHTTIGTQPATNMANQQAPPAAPSNRPTKRSANDFRFGKSIGEGSFSTVYLAKDIHTNKEYASKWNIFFFFYFAQFADLSRIKYCNAIPSRVCPMLQSVSRFAGIQDIVFSHIYI